MKLVRAQNSSNALNNRLSAHANYAKFEINDWIIPKLEIMKDDQVLDIACGNVIDREFSETLIIKLPKQLLTQWKKQKKRFEGILGWSLIIL